jgi:hypothetical protein
VIDADRADAVIAGDSAMRGGGNPSAFRSGAVRSWIGGSVGGGPVLTRRWLRFVNRIVPGA